MAEFFQELARFGIAVGGVGFVVAYLIRKLTEQQLSKDLEEFKSDLQRATEIEKLEYTILQEKRASVISELYSLLSDFEDSARNLTLFPQLSSDLPEIEKAKLVAENANKFQNYYFKHRIYFNDETCQLVEKLNNVIQGTLNTTEYQNSVLLFKNIEIDHARVPLKTIIEEMIPSLRRNLEDIFRELLGIKNSRK